LPVARAWLLLQHLFFLSEGAPGVVIQYWNNPLLMPYIPHTSGDPIVVVGDAPSPMRICPTRPVNTICAPDYTTTGISGLHSGACDVVTPTCDCLAWSFAGIDDGNSNLVVLDTDRTIGRAGCIDFVLEPSIINISDTTSVSFFWQVEVTPNVLPPGLAVAVVRSYYAIPGRKISLANYIAIESPLICSDMTKHIPPVVLALNHPKHARDKCRITHVLPVTRVSEHGIIVPSEPTPPNTRITLLVCVVLIPAIFSIAVIWKKTINLRNAKKDN
tara:strand:- start:367 stop:1185 length:819 start_codon:yes stop_codon:yes gene_type:complete